MNPLKGREILITGGTGSLGKTLTKLLIKDNHNPRGIRIFSRDELKQWNMQREMVSFQQEHGTDIKIAYIVGDIRNYDSLYRAFENVDVIINTAAMKQIPTCENNPIEAILTNVNGVKNIIKASLSRKVKQVMHVSTDKAVHAVNLYGTTKAVGEKLMVHANVYSGRKKTAFSCCRYGNVLGSRGSIIPLFMQQISEGVPVTITDLRMTRFWITLPTVGRFLLSRIIDMQGGEIFIPRMNALSIMKIVYYLWNEKQRKEKSINITNMRPGEKMHECIIAPEEVAIKIITQAKLNSSTLKKNGQIESDIDIGDWYYKISHESNYSPDPLFSNSKENHELTEKEFKNMLKETV